MLHWSHATLGCESPAFLKVNRAASIPSIKARDLTFRSLTVSASYAVACRYSPRFSSPIWSNVLPHQSQKPAMLGITVGDRRYASLSLVGNRAMSAMSGLHCESVLRWLLNFKPSMISYTNGCIWWNLDHQWDDIMLLGHTNEEGDIWVDGNWSVLMEVVPSTKAYCLYFPHAISHCVKIAHLRRLTRRVSRHGTGDRSPASTPTPWSR